MIKCCLKRKQFEQYMVKHNMSQNDLASILGLSSGLMSQYMSGKRNPGPRMRNKIMYEFCEKKWDRLFDVRKK